MNMASIELRAGVIELITVEVSCEAAQTADAALSPAPSIVSEPSSHSVTEYPSLRNLSSKAALDPIVRT